MDNKIPSRYNWNFYQNSDCILKSKDRLIEQYIRYQLVRTQQIFEYKGLPDTIPVKDLELLLQINGYATITKVNGKLYAFYGGLGGPLNEYYLPTISTVSNPYLNFTDDLKIDENCIVMLNDSLYIGLTPMFEKYASLLAETDISLRLASINARATNILIADNDVTKESAKSFINKLEKGELSYIGSNGFFEGIKTQEYASNKSNNIKDLIELQQYLKSSWFIDLGLNANYNMKRESINESESAMNEDCLLPLIDDMLKQRKLGIEKINKMFGTNITVELSSSWKDIREEIVHIEDTTNNDVEGGDEHVTKSSE